jgi:hypothetical protein
LDVEGVPIIAISLDPGAVNTFWDRLPKPIQPIARFIMFLFFKTWDKGAYNSVFSAAAPIVHNHPKVYKGAYIEGDYGKVVQPSKVAQDPEIAAELWKTTVNFLETIGLD